MRHTLVVKALVFSVTVTMILLSGTSIYAAGIHPGATSENWNPFIASGPNLPDSAMYSKLLVNQPNGDVDAVLTGVMNDLNASATYSVYLSAFSGSPFVTAGSPSITGTWTLAFMENQGKYKGGPYYLTLDVTEASDGTLTGISNDGGRAIETGSFVSGNYIVLNLEFTSSGSFPGQTTTVTGTISSSGISGTWANTNDEVGDYGTFYTSSTPSGFSWTPTATLNGISTITFTTDSTGSGSWHVNLYDSNFGSPSVPTTFTLWVLVADSYDSTVLTSESFTVTVG